MMYLKEKAIEELARRELERRKFEKTGDIFKTKIEGFNTTLLVKGLVVKVRHYSHQYIKSYEERRYFINYTSIDKIKLINPDGDILTLYIDAFDKSKKVYYEITEIF